MYPCVGVFQCLCHEVDVLGIIEVVEFGSLGAKASEREDDGCEFHEIGVSPCAFGVCVCEDEGDVFCDPVLLFVVPDESVDAVREDAGEAYMWERAGSCIASELVCSVTEAVEFCVGVECFEGFDDGWYHEDVHEVLGFLWILELGEVEEVFLG